MERQGESHAFNKYRGGQAIEVRKLQSLTFRYRKSANFFYVPVRKSQSRYFYKILSQNSPKISLCKRFFMFKFELQHYMLYLYGYVFADLRKF
jgi:hypothetical protein